jgi:uroporphyrinogen-III synthase
MSKILLTRSNKLSPKNLKAIQEQNYQTIAFPLFKVERLLNFPLTNKDLQAILITSSNAAFALTKLKINKDILILTVGEKTLQAVEGLGYSNSFCANNSSKSLLSLAKSKLSKNKGLVVYLSGEIITSNLADKLSKHGFIAKKIAVYKTVEAKELSKDLIEEIEQKNICQVWVYSKNSFCIFYKLLKKHNLLECLGEIKILCLSNEIADYAKEIASGFKQIEAAEIS